MQDQLLKKLAYVSNHQGPLLSATQYVLLERLKRASFRLAFEKNITVTDIAFEAQFDSSEAFSRAFSRTFGQTPSEFRNQPEWQHWHSKYEFNPPKLGEYVVDVNIVEFAEQPIAFIEHRGNPQRVLTRQLSSLNGENRQVFRQ